MSDAVRTISGALSGSRGAEWSSEPGIEKSAGFHVGNFKENIYHYEIEIVKMGE